MARRGENIYQRRDRRWEARVIIGRKQNGRAKYKYLYGHSYCEVKEKKKAFIIEIENKNPFKQPKAGTVAYVSELWLREIAASLKESSVCRYREKLDTYILPEFGTREFSDISTDEVAAFIALLQTDGYNGRKPIGSSSASMVLTVFKQLRLHALRADLKVRFSPECIKVKSHKSTVEAFSEEEETSLIKHLKKDMGNTEAGVLTMLFTGIRVGELCALNCDNIDLDAGIIHINQTMQRLPIADGDKKTSVRINSPKSDSSIRDVPITKELSELLQGICQPGV
ncbi:MAG: tyrosine-type recombinase/integrase, partial [Lachnospiraceae bacterium]|nr:tyrosine-type recombinase/integrase [Lachnospiraceae bacterium]